MKSLVIGISVLGAVGAALAESVDINLNVRHTVGGVDTFQRDVYMLLHAGMRDNDWDSAAQRSSFLTDYDVYLGRNNGSLPWNLSQTTEDPAKAGWCNHANMLSRGNTAKANYAADTSVHPLEFRMGNMMIGGQMSMYPNGQINGNGFAITNYAALGDYFEHYFSYFHGTGTVTGEPKPAMVEVVNEPFVSAGSYGTTRENIAQMHNEVAIGIKNSHPDILVGGYTAAHPQYEGGSFGHWDANWKMFIDVAGTNMDFFSLHLYDNPGGSTNVLETQYRSGSNVEALLDMIEHYSMLSLGEIKPFAISEYGSLSITNGVPYDPRNDWVDVRSFSTILMQLLERPDRMLQAMPFMILKAEWGRHANGYPYPTRLLYDEDELLGDPLSKDGPWVYTQRIKFFELWKEVNGTRVDTIASDPDIQVDAYVDGDDAYVIVSSLDHTGPQTVDLNLFGASAGLQQVEVKHSCRGADDMPTLDHYVTNELSSITLGASATAVLKYTFASPQVIAEVSDEKKYYATTYLQPIDAGAPIDFTITNVNTASEFGEAVLRLGIGREHGKSLQPTLYVNGTYVHVPDDWRGYDQATRDQFYGVLEIPVHYDLLQNSNTVSVVFDDAGGHVASVSLQVFEQSTEVRDSAFVLSSDMTGADMIINVSNAPANSYYTLLSTSNLLEAAWATNQTALPIDGSGFGSVTSGVAAAQAFYQVMLGNPPPPPPPPEPTVIEFAAPDYSDGNINNHADWASASGPWTVDATAGTVSCSSANDNMTYLNGTGLSEGESLVFTFRYNVQGSHTPTAWKYLSRVGVATGSSGGNVGYDTPGTSLASAMFTIQSHGSTTNAFRAYGDGWDGPVGALLAGNDAGDEYAVHFTITLGADAASTTFSVELENVTKSTTAGTITETDGVGPDLYNALVNGTAYPYLETGGLGDGISGVQVNSFGINIIP